MTPSERMKKSSYVSSYFVAKNFFGELKQSITLTISDYRHFATLYDLDDSSMSRKFASALAGPARAFILRNVFLGMPLDEMKKLMVAE